MHSQEHSGTTLTLTPTLSATMHSVTDRRMDGHYDAKSQSWHTA